MELTQLKQFKCIAETENMQEASEQLFVSQPALSKTIKKLETELGKNLFDREKNRLKLNFHGEITLAYTDIILDILAKMHNEIDDIKQHEVYNICSNSVGIPNYVIPLLSIDYPKARIFCTTNSYNLKTMLLDETFDMVISSYKIEHAELSNDFLFDDSVFLSVPASNILLYGKNHIEIDDLKSQTLVETKRGNPAKALYAGPIESRMPSIKCYYQANFDALYAFADNNGYLFFADSVSAKHIKLKNERKFVPYGSISYKCYMVYLKKNEQRIKFMIDWLHEYFKD